MSDIPEGFEIESDMPPGFEIESTSGPSGPAGSTDALTSSDHKDKTTALQAAVSSMNYNMPGAQPISAAIMTAQDPNARLGNLLDTFQKHKAALSSHYRTGAREHPIASVLGSVPSVAATSMAAGAAIPELATTVGGQVGTDFLRTVAGSAAQNASNGEGLSGMGWDLGFASGAKILGDSIKTGWTKLAGRAAEAPQRALDATADAIGGSTPAKIAAAGGQADLPDSARVVRLQKLVDDFRADPSKKAYLTGDDALAWRIAEADKAGTAVLTAEGMQLPVRPLAGEKTSLAGELADAGDRELSSALKTHFPGREGKTADVIDSITYAASQSEQEAKERLGRAMRMGDPEEMGDYTASLFAKRGEAARDFERRSGEALGSESRGMLNKLADARTDSGIARETAFDAIHQKALGFKQQIADIAEKQAAAEQSQAALGRMKTGRQAIGNAAGMASAIASGHGIGGPAGAVLAAGMGKPLGQGLISTIDMAGELGRKMQGVSSIIEDLARQENAIGNAARWALSAEGDAQIVRMAALADLPEVRDMLGL